MAKIYVPNLEGACYVIQDNNTIRVYSDVPRNDRDVAYTDYLLNAHYLERTGTQHFNQYSTLPTCQDINNFTDNYYYRHDISDILVSFSIIAFFGFYIPFSIVMKLFKKGRV